MAAALASSGESACCVKLMDGLVEVDADPAQLIVSRGIKAPRLLYDDGSGQQHAAGIVRNGQIRLLRRLPDRRYSAGRRRQRSISLSWSSRPFRGRAMGSLPRRAPA